VKISNVLRRLRKRSLFTVSTDQRIPTDSGRASWAMQLEALSGGLILFPLLILLLAVLGFTLGIRLNPWTLPVAAASTLVFLRVFSGSWRATGLLGAVLIGLHLVAYFVACAFFDGSYDGIGYHQEAILRLAAGWNPLFENAAAWGEKHELWIDHYPKASWIAGAALLLNTGQIEPGKLFNFTLIAAAGCEAAAVLLRLTHLRAFAVSVLAFLIALNPVAIYQSMAFTVDGQLASCLTIATAALTSYVAIGRWFSLWRALFAICLVINLKLNGAVYAVVLLAGGFAAVAYRRGLRETLKPALMAGAVGFLAICFLGYSPYIRNLREKGNLFYPVRGSNNLVDTGGMRPSNLADKNRIQRFLISNFSRSGYVRTPEATTPKFPFMIYPEERFGWHADIEAGGFGPLYGGLLWLTSLALLILFVVRSTRKNAVIASVIIGVLLASIFVHSETWWARYVPQAWLLPLIIAAASLLSPRRSASWWIGWAMVVITAFNVLFIGYYDVRHEWAYTQAMRRSLLEMDATEPVNVYFGPFLSLRQRLQEYGVEFTTSEIAPDSDQKAWRTIPPGSDAFWSE
jgi:hypothetical protein